MGRKRVKALCPKCGVRWMENDPAPEHEADCPFPEGFFPVVIFRPMEMGQEPAPAPSEESGE